MDNQETNSQTNINTGAGADINSQNLLIENQKISEPVPELPVPAKFSFNKVKLPVWIFLGVAAVFLAILGVAAIRSGKNQPQKQTTSQNNNPSASLLDSKLPALAESQAFYLEQGAEVIDRGIREMSAEKVHAFWILKSSKNITDSWNGYQQFFKTFKWTYLTDSDTESATNKVLHGYLKDDFERIATLNFEQKPDSKYTIIYINYFVQTIKK